MRLVDADEAKKYLYEHLDDLHMIAAQNAIDEMPTIDAQPVKHGHWIETRRYRDADGCIVSDYSCSWCGSVLRETNPDDRDSELYCYRCGAKMDGDADEQ
jgi:hypothetical protein